MNIEITKPALNWFKKEFDLEEKEGIRIFARYGGCGTVHSGFSLGISKEQATSVGAKIEIDDLLFFITEEDLWYFDQFDLKVKYSTKHEEIEFVYEPN